MYASPNYFLPGVNRMIGKKVLFGAGITLLVGGIGAIITALLNGDEDEDIQDGYDRPYEPPKFSFKRREPEEEFQKDENSDDENQVITDEEVSVMNDLEDHLKHNAEETPDTPAEEPSKEASSPSDFVRKPRKMKPE